MSNRFTSVLAAAAIAITAIAAPASASPFAGVAGTIQGAAQMAQENAADNVIQVSRRGGKGHRGGRHHGKRHFGKWHGHKFHYGHGYRYHYVDDYCWISKKFRTHRGFVWKRVYVC